MNELLIGYCTVRLNFNLNMKTKSIIIALKSTSKIVKCYKMRNMKPRKICQFCIHFITCENLHYFHAKSGAKSGYNSMTRVTNIILHPSIPNLQYKKYLIGRLTLTLITVTALAVAYHGIIIQIPLVIQKYTKLPNFTRLYFPHFTTYQSFTNFSMLFLAVVVDFVFHD